MAVTAIVAVMVGVPAARVGALVGVAAMVGEDPLVAVADGSAVDGGKVAVALAVPPPLTAVAEAATLGLGVEVRMLLVVGVPEGVVVALAAGLAVRVAVAVPLRLASSVAVGEIVLVRVGRAAREAVAKGVVVGDPGASDDRELGDVGVGDGILPLSPPPVTVAVTLDEGWACEVTVAPVVPTGDGKAAA